jgi:hypothetical protein
MHTALAVKGIDLVDVGLFNSGQKGHVSSISRLSHAGADLFDPCAQCRVIHG